MSIDIVEEVLISVSGPGVPDSQWRTVCFGASNAEDVTSTLSRMVKVNPPSTSVDTPVQEIPLEDYLLGSGGQPMGYPEFVLDRVKDKSISK